MEDDVGAAREVQLEAHSWLGQGVDSVTKLGDAPGHEDQVPENISLTSVRQKSEMTFSWTHPSRIKF